LGTFGLQNRLNDLRGYPFDVLSWREGTVKT